MSVKFPCVQKNFKMVYTDKETQQKYEIEGSPNMAKCKELLISFMRLDERCPFGDSSNCGAENRFQPEMDEQSEIIGISTVFEVAHYLGFTSKFTLN